MLEDKIGSLHLATILSYHMLYFLKMICYRHLIALKSQMMSLRMMSLGRGFAVAGKCAKCEVPSYSSCYLD